jgi:hypothetical protein
LTTPGNIIVKEVKSRKDLKVFIHLPEEIHKDHTNWVPPIYSDEWKFYSPRHNRSFMISDTILFLAYRDKEPVGRIMGIINRKYNEDRKEATARFFNFECKDDFEIAHVLISAIEKWAIHHGMNKLIGPFGFSDKDPQGIQIEGFDYLPVIATASNQPYIQSLIEKNGYTKEMDCVVYGMEVPQQTPGNYNLIYDKIIKENKLKLVEFESRSELKPYIIPVLKLVNETYKSLYGFLEMDDEEMMQLANKYKPLLNPNFTKLVVDNSNNIAAFVISSPDISAGIKKAKGRLFPFGIFYILQAMRNSKQLDLFLGAVSEKYSRKGVTALLGVSLFRSARKRGIDFIDSHLILETNIQMRNVMERLGATIYKRYRIYQKCL